MKEIREHIWKIFQLTGVKYVLERDSKYGYKICLVTEKHQNIMIFRGSLEKLNKQLSALEESAIFWSS